MNEKQKWALLAFNWNWVQRLGLQYLPSTTHGALHHHNPSRYSNGNWQIALFPTQNFSLFWLGIATTQFWQQVSKFGSVWKDPYSIRMKCGRVNVVLQGLQIVLEILQMKMMFFSLLLASGGCNQELLDENLLSTDIWWGESGPCGRWTAWQARNFFFPVSELFSGYAPQLAYNSVNDFLNMSITRDWSCRWGSSLKRKTNQIFFSAAWRWLNQKITKNLLVCLLLMCHQKMVLKFKAGAKS